MQSSMPVYENLIIDDLPNPQVLLEYLDLYVRHRTKENEAFFAMLREKFKYGFEFLASFFVRQKPVDDSINSLVQQVQKEISQAKTYEQWYNLIFTLREHAAEAQGYKYPLPFPFTIPTSRLSETLHALAGMIIFSLSNNPKFKKRIEILQGQAATLYTHEKYCIEKKDGIGAEADKKKRNLILLILAKLGDNTAIDEVMDKIYKEDNDLKYLKRPDKSDLSEYHAADANVAIPLCLQREFFEWLYELLFRSMNLTELKSFIKIAALKVNQQPLESVSYKPEQNDMDEEHVMDILNLSIDELKNGPITSELNSEPLAPVKPEEKTSEIKSGTITPAVATPDESTVELPAKPAANETTLPAAPISTTPVSDAGKTSFFAGTNSTMSSPSTESDRKAVEQSTNDVKPGDLVTFSPRP